MTGRHFGSDQTRPLEHLVRDPALRAAIAYWDSIRGGRLVPPRMSLDPSELRAHLQNAAILEVPRSGTVRIRLAGGRINALMGMEVRGMPLRALFDLADRGRITDATERALADPSVLIVDAISPAPRFGAGPAEQVRTQIAILPMTDNELATTRALYVMSDPVGATGHSEHQHRWSVQSLDMIPIEAGTPIAAVEQVRSHAPMPMSQPAHASDTGIEAEERGAFARARFRVIQGGLA